MSTQLTDVYLAFKDFAEPLLERFSSYEEMEYLFYRYGWQVMLDEQTFSKLDQLLSFKAPLEQFLQTAESIQQKLDQAPDATVSAQDVAVLAQSVSPLIDALTDFKLSSFNNLSNPLGDPEFWKSIGEHLLDDLLEEYLRIYHPNVYLVLHFWGGIRYEPTQLDAPFRRQYTKIVFDWHQVLAMLRNPLTALKQTYHWGDPTATFEYQRLFEALTNVLRAIHLPTDSIAPSLQATNDFPADSSHQIQSDVNALKVLFLNSFSPSKSIMYEVGMELFPAAKAGQLIPSGLLLRPILRGGAEGKFPLNKLFLMQWKIAASADDVIGLVIFPDTIDLVGGPLAVGASLAIVGTSSEPWYLFGNQRTARIEIASPAIGLSVQGSVDDPEARLHLGAGDSTGQPGVKVVIPLDDADSFIKETASTKPLELSFSPEVIWSTKTGLTFNGKPNLDLDLPMNFSVGPVRVQHLLLRLMPQGNGEDAIVAFEASAGMSITLGPVVASVDGLGFLLRLDFARDQKNLGFVDLSFGFKPPSGLSLSIDTSDILGGGFLRFDPHKQEYSGVLELQIAERIAVKGMGMLTTQLPDGARGYSLVVIIFTQGFAPIQLGFGFTLTGIGGLLAINRTFDEAALRAGLKNHTLDSILFPQDPIRNAPQILSNLNKVFPPAKGHYLFGPMAQIAWGTPPLITANLALVLEFGARLRLLILAQVVAILPKRENDLVRLQMDAIGVIDFDQGTAELDATLHDSRLLKKFVLTGDMAMRLKWEGSPNFALAIGGLHPAFNPPPNFPKLERIAINLCAGDNPRFRCEAYFALTSNTVQFGARAELYAEAGGGFSIQGETGFDVLIQLDPFHFLADFYAQLQLKRHSTNLFKVRVEGALSGPRPLHIKAKATFEILWWDYSIRIDKTLVEGELPPLPEPINVLPRLKEALGNPGNWKGQLPENQRPMVTLRAKPEVPNEVLLHPLGTLIVKQSIVPLNLDISRFGQAAPAGARRFTINSVSLGSQNQTIQSVKDFFAPAQFLEMSDDEKLSRPSFEPMDAGISIGSNEFDFSANASDWLEVAEIAFETIIVDKQTNTSRHSDPADPRDPEGSKKFYTLSPELLGKQALFGAAGNSDLRRTGKAKYRATIASFKITEQSLTNLKTEGVPDDVLEKLQGVKKQEVRNEEGFLALLKTTIGDEQTVKFKSLIMKHATTMGKYRVAKEGWSIVATDNLTVQTVPGIEAGKPTIYSEAAQALRKLKQENPAQADGLKILRLSEIALRVESPGN